MLLVNINKVQFILNYVGNRKFSNVQFINIKNLVLHVTYSIGQAFEFRPSENLDSR